MAKMIKAGDPIEAVSATDLNRAFEAADDYFRRKARGDQKGRPATNYDPNCVKVLNNSGAVRRAGEVLEFTSLRFTTLADDRPLWFTGSSPTLANGFGVLVRGMPASTEWGVDDCVVAGPCKALVNVTNTAHQFAYCAYGSYVLQSAPLGPVRILFKPSGTGERECGVLLDQSGFRMYRGVTNSAIAKGESNRTVSRYRPGTTTDTGIDDTVTNEMADIGSGKVVYYMDDGGGILYVIAAECPLV